jgi:hypothetical protein
MVALMTVPRKKASSVLTWGWGGEEERERRGV